MANGRDRDLDLDVLRELGAAKISNRDAKLKTLCRLAGSFQMHTHNRDELCCIERLTQ
jgi:hypothetical protein